ncbi:hypothetical protein FOB31_16095 [Burkholderia multivorans]|nr:hypothetical protein FOB31_16095 [Burkholderia multivorans]
MIPFSFPDVTGRRVAHRARRACRERMRSQAQPSCRVEYRGSCRDRSVLFYSNGDAFASPYRGRDGRRIRYRGSSAPRRAPAAD